MNDDEAYLDAASHWWNDTKKEWPKAALAASVLPVTGQITSALELHDAIKRDDKTDMALAAAGLIPGAKLVTSGAKALRAGQAIQHAARNTLTGADVYSASKKAGQVMKNSGGTAVTAGVGAEAASTASNLDDYAHEWNSRE